LGKERGPGGGRFWNRNLTIIYERKKEPFRSWGTNLPSARILGEKEKRSKKIEGVLFRMGRERSGKLGKGEMP